MATWWSWKKLQRPWQRQTKDAAKERARARAKARKVKAKQRATTPTTRRTTVEATTATFVAREPLGKRLSTEGEPSAATADTATCCTTRTTRRWNFSGKRFNSEHNRVSSLDLQVHTIAVDSEKSLRH